MNRIHLSDRFDFPVRPPSPRKIWYYGGGDGGEDDDTTATRMMIWKLLLGRKANGKTLAFVG